MGIADKLVDNSYIPRSAGSGESTDSKKSDNKFRVDFIKVIKCPVEFTDDPIEYAEKFIQYRLKPVQRMVLEDLFSVDEKGKPIYNHAVFIAGMRCHGFGTEVMMYDGTTKRIEDVIVGDLLMGPDSRPRKVLSVHYGHSQLYRIKQSRAMDYTVNSLHILSLKRRISSKELVTFNVPVCELVNSDKKILSNFFGYKAKCIYFPFRDVPIDPYLLGLWLGDGSGNINEIRTIHPEVIDWLKLFGSKYDSELVLEYNYPRKYGISIGFNFKKSIIATFRCSQKLIDIFKQLKILEQKRVPHLYIANVRQIRLRLLAGVIDSCGRATSKGYMLEFSSGVLANDVKYIADTLGIRTRIVYKRSRNWSVSSKWKLYIDGNLNEVICFTGRKKRSIIEDSNTDNLSKIKIENIGYGPYAGVEIDGDNLYCLADGTVTHNSGKSILGGIVGSFLLHKLLAMDNPGKELGQVPGQKFVAEYIATSEQQSKQTAYAAFETIMLNTPWWRKYIAYLRERELTEGKESLFQQHERKVAFKEKNLEVLSLHSNSASIAGFTAFFVCFDEMSRFDVSEGEVQQRSEKRSAQAVYYTAARAAKTLSGFSKILTITSPMYETDFGMQLLYMSKVCKAGPSTERIVEALRARYTTRVDDIVGYHFCTYEANPKTEEDPFGYDSHSFDAEKAANYTAFLRDYMAIPPAAISPFFELPERLSKSVVAESQSPVIFYDELIEQKVSGEIRKYIGKRVQVISGNKMNKYFICCDQGAVKDSFVVAMGHAESTDIDVPDARGGTFKSKRHKVVIDFVEAWRPNKEDRITVSFQNVEEVIKILNNHFYISLVVFDQWHSTESIERLFSEGIMAKKLGADIEMYETFKLLIYSGMVDLPNNDLLLNELRQLNVIKNKKIDHPEGGCFTGDTRILLTDGTTVSLEKLASFGPKKTFKVYACTQKGVIVPAFAYNAHKSKTVDELIQVTLEDGEVHECTSDHLWLLSSGAYKRADELNEDYTCLLYTSPSPRDS